MDKLDAIYKRIDGGFYSQYGHQLDICEVFRKDLLHCFSGDEYPLIVAQWNVSGAKFVVVGQYEKKKNNI